MGKIMLKIKKEGLKYCILCAIYEIHKKKNSQDMYHYNKLKDDRINWNHMAYPAGNRDIDRFEESNNGLISINVFEECKFLDGQTITIHRRTKVINAKYHINRLKIYDDKGKFHYVYISDYNKRIVSQTNNSKNKLYHCNFCQHGFKREDLLERHLSNGC